NYQSYVTTVDTLNNVDPAFPGFANHGGQFSNRFADSLTLRSTLTPTLVNEARAGLTGGTVLFFPEVNSGQFGNQAGFAIGSSASESRASPIQQRRSAQSAEMRQSGISPTP